MIRVSVLYPNPGKFDMDYYLTKHMGLVHKLLDSMGWSELKWTRVSA